MNSKGIRVVYARIYRMTSNSCAFQTRKHWGRECGLFFHVTLTPNRYILHVIEVDSLSPCNNQNVSDPPQSALFHSFFRISQTSPQRLP